MTYAVLGVSGHTGKVVAETLLEQGKRVRAVVRDASKAAALKAKGAEVAIADLGDASALSKALSGVEGAYVLIPPSFAPGFRDYQNRTTDALVSAAKQAQPPHLVLLSSIAAHQPAGTGPIAGIHYTEQQLRTLTKTHSTFLRAAYFMENLGSSLGMLNDGVLPSFFPADFEFEMVATHDVGIAAAKLLVEGTSKTRVVDVKGPRGSFAKAAQVLSELTAKPIRVAEAPMDAAVPTLTSFGFPTDLAELYRDMMAGMLSGLIRFEPGHEQIIGKTPLKQVLAELLAQNAKVR
jgi:uncharacterized protein YbjT (DUF2867 family)